MESTGADTTVFTVKRTTTFLVSLLVALCSGTPYIYSVYGPQLGRRLQLSYVNQNLVGLSGYYGMCAFGPLLGKLADSRGPRPGLALGFTLLLTGYLGVRGVYDASKNNTEPARGETSFVLVLFELFIGIGSEASCSGVLNATMKSFPEEIRSTMTGVVISGLGLSASLFSMIARTIFPGNISDFLLVLAFATPIPMVLGLFLIRICPYPEHAARKYLKGNHRNEPNDQISTPNETSRLLVGNTSAQLPGIGSLTMIRTIDFWILFWIVSLLSGSGIMWINNLGLMARALVLKHNASPDNQEYAKWQTLHVLTFSIASCIGRILIGAIADFANYRGIQRIQCFSIVAVSVFVSQLVGLLVQENEQLQYAVFLVGVSYGGVFGLSPVIVLELFGIAHVSENLSLNTLSSLVMGPIFSMFFGRVFDGRSTHSEEGIICLEGTRCYSVSLWVTALASLCALWLTRVAAKRDKRYE